MQIAASKSLLKAMQDYIQGCPYLKYLDIHIDQTDDGPVNYSVQTAGLVLLGEDVLGNQKWQYNAILQSREYTTDDISRLEASDFTDKFVFWIHRNNNLGIYPEIDQIEPIEIKADNGICLAVDDDGDRGIYQIQIHFIFQKEV